MTMKRTPIPNRTRYFQKYFFSALRCFKKKVYAKLNNGCRFTATAYQSHVGSCTHFIHVSVQAIFQKYSSKGTRNPRLQPWLHEHVKFLARKVFYGVKG